MSVECPEYGFRGQPQQERFSKDGHITCVLRIWSTCIATYHHTIRFHETLELFLLHIDGICVREPGFFEPRIQTA